MRYWRVDVCSFGGGGAGNQRQALGEGGCVFLRGGGRAGNQRRAIEGGARALVAGTDSQQWSGALGFARTLEELLLWPVGSYRYL